VAAASTAGPKVTGVSLLKAHHRITGMVISFNGALSSGSASNAANYSVHLLSVRRSLRLAIRLVNTGKSVPISAAAYDPNGHSVTLTFAAKYRASQVFQIRVNSGQGGISDLGGDSLNSPSRGVAGSDFVAAVNSPAS
jgi:hypothetical protein